MNTDASTDLRRRDELLRQAAQWRLISLLLECPGEGWFEQAGALAREADDESLRLAVAAAQGEASAGLYFTTLGPGGPAAPREVSYVETLMPGQSLAQLRMTYDAFAYRPASDEPPDHVAVEAGFMAYLRLKEAYALARGDQEQAGVAAAAAAAFLRDHLAAPAHGLAKSLAASGVEYLALTAAALLERVGPSPVPDAATPPVSVPLPFLNDQDQDGCAFDSPDESGI